MSIYPLWSFRNRTIKIEEKAKNKASPCFLCLPLCLSLLSLCLASLGVSPIVCLLLSLLPFAILKKTNKRMCDEFDLWYGNTCALTHYLTNLHTYTQEHTIHKNTYIHYHICTYTYTSLNTLMQKHSSTCTNKYAHRHQQDSDTSCHTAERDEQSRFLVPLSKGIVLPELHSR